MRRMVAILSLLSISSASFAQISSTKNDVEVEKTSTSSQGLRLSVGSSNLQIQSGPAGEIKDNQSKILSFGAGYANFPANEVGGYVGLKYFELHKEDNTTGLTGLMLGEAMAGYTIGEHLALKLGFNFSKFVNGQDASRTTIEAGLQGGLALQFTKVIGLDLTYRKLDQHNADSNGLNYHEEGTEAALTATF